MYLFVFLHHNSMETGYLLLTYSSPTVIFPHPEVLLINSALKPTGVNDRE